MITKDTKWIQFASGGGAEPLMVRASTHMTADNMNYSCMYLNADGTVRQSGIDMMRPRGVYVQGSNVGFVGRDKIGNRIFIDAHSWPRIPVATNTVGATSEGSETAASSKFNFLNTAVGLILNAMTRVAYYDAGDQKLYGYVRSLTFDAMGHLASIGGETRVTIDVPGVC